MSEKRPGFEVVHKAAEIGEERFKPTCRICGRQHWPLDPSCIGKKGVKAEAKARAKAEKLARAEAKARARAAKKVGAGGKFSAEVESALREEFEARSKAEREKIETQREKTQEVLEEERRARERMEAELKAEREARLRAEEQAAEYARQREEVRQWAVLAEQEKLKAEEKLRAADERLSAAEARAEAKARAEAEAMARVDVKERGGDIDESGEAVKRAPDGGTNAIAGLLELRAGDIMERDVTWCGPQESVGWVVAKMRQAGCEYVVIGNGGTAEGIVSRAELKGRLSPAVRRAMGKWKRGGSDATLGMAVKFVMIRGVQVVSEDTPITSLMKQMRQSRCRVLAVADEDGKVAGLVTACNVLKIRALLRLEGNPNLLEAEEGDGRDVPSAVSMEIGRLDAFKPSGIFRRAGKTSKSEVSTL